MTYEREMSLRKRWNDLYNQKNGKAQKNMIQKKAMIIAEEIRNGNLDGVFNLLLDYNWRYRWQKSAFTWELNNAMGWNDKNSNVFVTRWKNRKKGDDAVVLYDTKKRGGKNGMELGQGKAKVQSP